MDPARKLPTLADLEALPESIKGEIIEGVLYTMPRPRAAHQSAAFEIVGDLRDPFSKGRGGPGGWRILPEPGIELPNTPEIAPDIAGWKVERLPELPRDEPIRVVPDWVCEILSPSTRRHNLLVKKPYHAKIGVRHHWLVDLDARTVTAYRLESGHWLEIGAQACTARARIPRRGLRMTATAHPADAPLSYEEYLRFEESVDSRHEFIDGDVLAMAGGTRRHAVLKSRVSTELTIGLGRGGPCRVEDSDTRIAVEKGDRINAYYPDTVVICGEGITHARDPDGGVLNPTLIVEVTSRSTEKRDRGIKLDDYRLLPSLRQYVIVSHVRQELEVWSRVDAEAEWTRELHTSGQVATLALGVTLAVDDLYREPLPPR